MYRVLDICRYIINYSNKEGFGVSNLKLQKLLYFIQADFLVNSKGLKPCFDEAIEAWDFGPVVPEAYREYKQYGSTDIPLIKSYIEVDKDDPWNTFRIEYDENCISDEDKNMINAVITKMADFSATDLVNITHNQAPWKDAYVQYANNEIKKSSIMEYFSGRK